MNKKRTSLEKPVTPAEVEKKRLDDIPDFVIKAFNNLITKNYSGGEARIDQDDVVAEIKRINKGTTSREIFDNGWLDVEPLFRKQGWSVNFDKPGYCETYNAFWLFSKKGSG